MNTSITFLLIDDDEDDRELFQLALEDLDHKTHFYEAASGRKALKMLENSHAVPDFIFLDLNMPEMNGKECLTILKQDHKYAGIPVIIFSTSSDPTDIKITKELGALDFITKPSKMSELTELLNKFILNQIPNTINSNS